MKKAQANQTLIVLANLVLGVVVMTPFIYDAAYGVTYGNAGIVAQDLGMTANTLQSIPTATQVQYQPDSSNYVISLSQQHVTVEAPSGTFKHELYRPPGVDIKPATLSYEPTISLTNTNNEIAFDNDEASSLSTFCEAINVQRNALTANITGSQELAQTITSTIESNDNIEIADDEDITVQLRARDDDQFLARHNENATSRLATDIGCNIVANTNAETSSFSSYNLRYDDEIPQGVVVIEIGEEASYDERLLGEAVGAGMIATVNDE